MKRGNEKVERLVLSQQIEIQFMFSFLVMSQMITT